MKRAQIAWIGAAAVAVAPAAPALTSSAAGQSASEVPVAWDVAEAGLDRQSLEIFVGYGGCVGAPFRPVVEETAAGIRITVLATEAPVPAGACPASLGIGLVRVALAGPLDGRSIRGRSGSPGLVHPSLIPTPRGTPRVRVPLLVGLNAFEARRALRLRGLRYKLRSSRGYGGRTQIRGQSPGGGRPIAQHGVVRLLVGLP